MPSLPSHALASGLRGFAVVSLRVRVMRLDENYAWVVTADLLDAGTALVLNRSQIMLEAEMEVSTPQHRDGLIVIG